MIASKKTTVMGICSLITALVGIVQAIVNNQPIQWETTIAAIVSGVGLISAKDFNVTNAVEPGPAKKFSPEAKPQ